MGFGRTVAWDVPLLEGYDHTFVPNVSRSPGTHHFTGIDNPDVVPTISRWKPDALLVYGWNYRSHLAVLRAFHGRVPILFRGDSTLIDEGPGLRKWARRVVLSWVYRRVDVALYVGSHNKDYFRAHGLKDAALQWAPHSVENDRFTDPDGSLERSAQQWKQELGIPSDAVVVLFAGKLERKKAPDLLLRAMMNRTRSNEHLIIVGTGELEEQLRRMAHNAPNVHFLGFQNQSAMNVVYRLGDVFVLPSRGPGETWGLAVNEAMASSRPVVVSDRVGCAPDLVRRNETGTVFSSDNQAGLDAAITPLLNSAPLRQRLGMRAAQHIQGWSLAEQARCIEEAVARALTGATGA
jgi:glycosyltransferase involved in cell wall biosynthesis